MTRSDKRLLQICAFVAAWAIVILCRLAQIQLVRHADFVTRAQRQQERTIDLQPTRGAILDAKLRVLAESVAAESIYADPQAVTDPRATAQALASIKALGLTDGEIRDKLADGGGFVRIARQLPLDVTAEVKKLKIPGIGFLEEHRRLYPRGLLASSVLGFIGVDGNGLAGIEHSLDPYIRGRAGKVTLLRDARKGMYLVGGEGANRAIDGNDVVLTIDSVIQFIAEESLRKAVEEFRGVAGSVIVMDPRDGAILAMASVPTFDPNRFRDFPAAAWRNRNVQDMYEPGSTFKIVTASAGLEESVVTPSQFIDCGDGFIRIGNTEIHEHGHNRYGVITFEDVMVHSSNVGAIRVGLSLGPNRFYDYIRRFGFGERTGIDLPGEANGLLRRTDRWSQLSNATMSIGQEIGATPLQVATAVATVANGGVRVAPRIVDRVVDASGNTIWRPSRPEPVRVISERTAAVLNEILKSVVARGTGQKAALPEHVVAGKTGTAQKAGRGGYSDKVVASFAGYVPADRPRLVILVVIDEPKTSQYGGTVAAPAFKEIAEASLRYLGVPPSLPSRSIGLGAPMLAEFSQRNGTTPSAGVPDLRGLDARAAIARAVAAGLTVRATGSGVVTSQEPLPGGALPGNHSVTLTLAEVVR